MDLLLLATLQTSLHFTSHQQQQQQEQEQEQHIIANTDRVDNGPMIDDFYHFLSAGLTNNTADDYWKKKYRR